MKKSVVTVQFSRIINHTRDTSFDNNEKKIFYALRNRTEDSNQPIKRQIDQKRTNKFVYFGIQSACINYKKEIDDDNG